MVAATAEVRAAMQQMVVGSLSELPDHVFELV
jgi:hypothetical protein